MHVLTEVLDTEAVVGRYCLQATRISHVAVVAKPPWGVACTTVAHQQPTCVVVGLVVHLLVHRKMESQKNRSTSALDSLSGIQLMRRIPHG